MLTNDQLSEIAKELRRSAADMHAAADSMEDTAERIKLVIDAQVEATKDILEILGFKPMK
jgi:hypothetical protein